MYRSPLETDHQLFSACREDVLRKVEGTWKVARRTIVLDANVLLDQNLSVFRFLWQIIAPPVCGELGETTLTSKPNWWHCSLRLN